MPSPFVTAAGHTLSADIAVPEHERVQRFYARVLTTGDAPMWREDLTNNHGIPIIGLGARTEDHDKLPLQWMPHIQVADIAASVREAVARGGKSLMYGKDDEGNAQWAVLLDPNGAAFGLIPVVPADAIPPVDGAAPMGHIAWLDLTVREAEDTREFYRQVIGWSVEEVVMSDGMESYSDYNMLGAEGQPAAGVCHARGANADLPPTWLIYLPVGDLVESLERVRAEGGQVLREATAEDGAFVFAVIQDPVGAVLALVPA
jgi:predicted enzyme related to lactoylglutathione lyase